IEHSVDARDFEAVGRVKGRGNTDASLSDYEFVHIPDSWSANQYYRLKQVDIDGRFAHSKFIRIAFPQAPGLAIAPNPADDHLTVAGFTGKWTAEIFSSSGQLLFESRDQKAIDVKHL